MENSPLKLYKKAYNLHYKEKNIAEASNIYREIVKNYPDSDASGYASIQLSKIQSKDITENISKQRTSSIWLVLTLFIINFILILGTLFLLVMHNQSINKRQVVISKIYQTIGKLYAGKEDEALILLNELKITTRKDITPFAISADIHLKNHEFNKARKEYEAFQHLYPGNQLASVKIDEINREEENYIKISKRIQKTEDTISADKLKKPGKTKILPKYLKRVPRKPKTINKDEVTYF